MLTTWEDYLYFYYVEVDPSQTNIKQLGANMLLDTFHTSLRPNVGYSAEVGAAVRLSRVTENYEKNYIFLR